MLRIIVLGNLVIMNLFESEFNWRVFVVVTAFDIKGGSFDCNLLK